MKRKVVMDTNVAITANGKSHAHKNCVLTCTKELERIRNECCVVIDYEWDILKEYMNQLNSSGQPGPGDVFLKWLLSNRQNPNHCSMVRITPHNERGYAEFPNAPDLANFDPSDRKFVAVALATDEQPPPSILNASDTDWWHHRLELGRHGIQIDFLCPDLMTKK